MFGDIELYGAYLPNLLALMLATFCLSLVLRRVLSWTGFYRLVWHRALFDLALYVILLGAVSTMTESYLS